MGTSSSSHTTGQASIVRGIPLRDEPGLGDLTIPGFVRDVTNRYAECEALVWRGERGAVRWSYAALWERSVEVARALIACGAGKGTRIGILMTNRPELLAAAFGTALAGGVGVLLSTFSTSRELEHLLDASGVSMLLFERRVARTDFAEMLVELEPGLRTSEPGGLVSTRFPFLRRLAMIDDGNDDDDEDGNEEADEEDDEARPALTRVLERWPDFLRRGDGIPASHVDATAATTTPADPGALFFSSGTTSLPKGVLHGHRAVAIQWWRWGRLMGMEAPVRSWTANGFFWSGNFSMVVGGTLASGGSLVLQPTFEPEEALELMQAEQVSFALAWPHQWAKLEDATSWQTVDLGHIRYVKAETPGAQHPTVHTTWLSPPSYGCTETLTISTALPSTATADEVAGSHGVPLPGNTLKIVNPIEGTVVPRGESGEILVKGPTLMLGYVGTPLDETLDDEGFFRSGDQGHVDEEGRLYWAGRLSDVIKTGGANVSPREIDTVLADCPGVRLSQTVGIPHDTLGEMVVTSIVAHDGVALEASEIRDYARERLAAYKVPRHVLFFAEDELEKSGSDKVKTSHLRQLITDRLAAIVRVAADGGDVGHRRQV